MRALLLLLIPLAAGCPKSKPEQAPEQDPSNNRTPRKLPPVAEFLADIPGDARLLARLSLADDRTRSKVQTIISALALDQARSGMRTKSLDDCKIALDRIDGIDVAVGESTSFVVEIHGDVQPADVACVAGGFQSKGIWHLGDSIATQTDTGVAVRSAASTESAAPKERFTRFTVSAALKPTLAVARFGRAEAEVLIEASVQDDSIRVVFETRSSKRTERLHAWWAAALKGAPALAAVELTRSDDTIEIVFPDLGPVRSNLKNELFETFRMPSTGMEPTLRQGDHFLVAKGNLVGVANKGELVVYAQSGGAPYAKRVIAIGGEHVRQQEGSLFVDGTPIPTSDSEQDVFYTDRNSETGEAHTERARSWREQHGGHAYSVLRSPDMALPDGEWDVPTGHVFVVGDNRDSSADSRMKGPVPVDDIKGRVIAVWWSSWPGQLGRLFESIDWSGNETVEMNGALTPPSK